ncbi:MAG: DUF2207 domain-containing protein [Methanosphaera sp.]|nr:DUF2207 domain-containing protein [Methanosphaera sp.]
MKTKIFIISLILMFLLVPVSFADDGDYTLPEVIKDITVNDDGSTIISEDVTYDIEGHVNGVYRDIPLANDQSITNISVETPGYYNKLEVIEQNGKTRLKVWLYKDEAKTKKVYDEKVEVIYKYTFNKGVKIYNDIAELQYMTWGKEWDSSVDYLESNIHIPGSNKDTEYWNNPEDYVVSSQWTNENTLTTKSESIGAHTSYEQRILMPKSYFKSTENAKVINMDAKAQIEEDQKKYKENSDFYNTMGSIITGIFGLLLFVPLAIYGLYGREPKISYHADYEYDLPTNSSPIEVNTIVDGDVGIISDNGIHATILDLINRKFYEVMASTDDDTVLRYKNQDTSNLKPFEKSLINYLEQFNVNGDISLKSIGETGDPVDFKDFKESWKIQARQEVPNSLINKYFISKGSEIFSLLSVVLLVLGIISIVITMFIDIPPHIFWILMIIIVIMIFESIMMMVIPNTFAGRWTPEGKEYHDKWKNFENYITDFSLIKERPPAAIQVWGKYLVYAAALGCAQEVTKNMKKYFDLTNVSEDYYPDSQVVLFAYYGGFDHLNSTFTSLTPSNSDSDGIGSVGGGGFGGGGGGTF